MTDSLALKCQRKASNTNSYAYCSVGAKRHEAKMSVAEAHRCHRSVAVRKQPHPELSLHRKYPACLPPPCKGSGFESLHRPIHSLLAPLESHLRREPQVSLQDSQSPGAGPLLSRVSISSCFPASILGRSSLLLTHPSPQQGGAFPSGAAVESGTHCSLEPLVYLCPGRCHSSPRRTGDSFLVWHLKSLPDRLHHKPSSSIVTS